MFSARCTAQIGLAAFLLIAAASLVALAVTPRFQRPVPYPEVGAAAPDFMLSDPDGRSVSLAWLRGRTVVLYFTMREEEPAALDSRLDHLARRYENDPRVLFLAIDLAGDPTRFRADPAGRAFPTLFDTRLDVARRYAIESLPAIAVIDPLGTLRYCGSPTAGSLEPDVAQDQWAEALQSILADFPPQSLVR